MKFGNITSREFKNKSIRQLVANFRNEYLANGIDERDMPDDPVRMFEMWFDEAVNAKVLEPNAMHLSTVSSEGKPSGRLVLLKGFDENGFVFFTNYDSRKSKELTAQKFAALTFYWGELYRQVRIEGTVTRISEAESDEYFNSRPRGSRLSALASPQSNVIGSREELEQRVAVLEEDYRDKDIPRPENWGGYIVYPQVIEFWQGRANRLHDRIRYTRSAGNEIWIKERLAP